MRASRAAELLFDSSRESETLASADPAPLRDFDGFAALAGFQAAKWLATGDNPQLVGRVVSVDPMTLGTTSHILVRRPQCAVCGEPRDPAAVPAPPRLRNRTKRCSAGSEQRTNTPEEVFWRLQHHISPVTGIVRDLAPLHGANSEIIDLWIATHNYSLDHSSPALLKHSLESKSGGKGFTPEQGRTGALVEALERFCGVFQGDEARITASLRELGQSAVHPNDVMLYSDLQYSERHKWNGMGSPFMFVPRRFDENERIEWSPLWSLAHHEYKYLPTAMLYYGCHEKGGEATTWADSNGNAAGNCIEEATLQGFFEIAERDAVAMWWYNRIRMPAVALETFDAPAIERCCKYYNSIARDLWVLDLTNDLQIPTFVALSRRRSARPEEITMGFGAHLNAETAVLRALAELNQFLPAVSGPVDGNGDRRYGYHDPHAIHWWRTATLERQPFLVPDTACPARHSGSYAATPATDQLWDLMTCVKRAQSLGLDTLFLDQSRPDIEIATVKIVVPGARHFWARLAPGRLYDVPVKMGWLPRQLAEDELNPIPMFL